VDSDARFGAGEDMSGVFRDDGRLVSVRAGRGGLVIGRTFDLFSPAEAPPERGAGRCSRRIGGSLGSEARVGPGPAGVGRRVAAPNEWK
jgi:hypothetical protein